MTRRFGRAESVVPRTISGLQLWLDARRPGATFADGDPVGTWKDLSGKGRDVTQATAAKKPLWRSTGRNLLTYNQATVETDTTGLVAIQNCAIARSTTYAAHGSASLATTANGSGDAIAGGLPGTSGTVVSPSTQYTAVVSCRSTAARTGKARIYWWKSNGAASDVTATSDGSTATTSTSAFTQYTCTATSPSDAAYATIAFVYAAPSNGDIAYLDQRGLWSGSSTTWVPPVTTPNGQPVVQFDGVDDVLALGSWALSQPCTVYGAVTPSVANITAYWFGNGNTAPRVGQINTGGYRIYAGSSVTVGAATTLVPHVISAVLNGAATVFSADGTASTIDAGTAATDTPFIGAYSSGSSPLSPWQGTIAAVLVYSGAHDANTRKRMERWLGRQYAVTVAQ